MMKIQKLFLIVLVVLGIGLWNAQSGSASNIDANTMMVVQGNNAFALDLYAQLKVKEGNLFFSPYSILTALTMTYAGARENTERQMAEVLHLMLGQKDVHQAVGDWIHDLDVPADSQQGYQLHTANNLWGQKGYGFLNAFLELLATYYKAGLTELDFAKATEEARRTINMAVEEQTEGKIRDLLKPGILDQSTALVLTNAVYFKGGWLYPFDKEKTHNAPFTLINGKQVESPMMRQMVMLKYTEDDVAQVVELPYQGERLSMILFLPKELAQQSDLEAKFSVAYIEKHLLYLQEQKVTVILPRFAITSEFSLPEALKKMGMTDAFTLPPADFSGMTGQKNLYISEVLHKAHVNVEEKGTEATTATAVVMSRGLGKNPVFQADHPFLFVIRDNRSGGFLFLGRVMNPNPEKS